MDPALQSADRPGPSTSSPPDTDPYPSNAFGGLEQRVLARWRRLGIDAKVKPATVVVGFSGGGDSVALACLLNGIASRAKLRPVLLHIDHAYRESSAAEATRAAALGSELGLPTRVVRLSAASWTSHAGVGIEEALRRERYRAFQAAVRQERANLLALAHHQDDQAETVLLHLLRGAGVSGASGMGEWTSIEVPWWEEHDIIAMPARKTASDGRLPVWRPLLSEPRGLLGRHIAASGLVPIEDPSNDDPRFRRNALRHEVLPLLERIVPGAAAALARYASLAADDDATLQQLADSLPVGGRSADASLPLSILDGRPPAIQRRVVRSWLAAQPGVGVPSAERTAAVLGLCGAGDVGRSVALPGGFRVVRGRHELRCVGGKGGNAG